MLVLLTLVLTQASGLHIQRSGTVAAIEMLRSTLRWEDGTDPQTLGANTREVGAVVKGGIAAVVLLVRGVHVDQDE